MTLIEILFFNSLAWSNQVLQAGVPGGQDENLCKTSLKLNIKTSKVLCKNLI